MHQHSQPNSDLLDVAGFLLFFFGTATGIADTKLPRVDKVKAKSSKKSKAPKRPAVVHEPSRRSKRSRGVVPEYTGEHIDR